MPRTDRTELPTKAATDVVVGDAIRPVGARFEPVVVTAITLMDRNVAFSTAGADVVYPLDMQVAYVEAPPAQAEEGPARTAEEPAAAGEKAATAKKAPAKK